MTLEHYLQDLKSQSQPASHRSLLRFSNLEPNEADVFRRVWPEIRVERRRSILEELLQLAEDNVDLDYTTVFKLCLEDHDARVRERAIHGLWECEERGLIPTLIGLLYRDPSMEVQAAAAAGLGKFATLAVDGKLLSKDTDRIHEALMGIVRGEESHPELQCRTLEAAAPFNTPEIRERIQDCYEREEEGFQRSAVYAMARTCDPQWLPLLTQALRSREPSLRYEAANACGEIGAEAAVPYLANLLTDGDLDVRLAATQSLGHIGSGQARRLLRQQLNSDDEAIADAAEEALREIALEEDPLVP